MKKKLLATLLVAGFMSVGLSNQESYADPVEVPSWFKEISVNEAVDLDLDGPTPLSDDEPSYYFISNDGNPLLENELGEITDGSVEILPNEEGETSNVIAIGKSIVNGVEKVDYYFSDNEKNDLEPFIENAIKVSTDDKSRQIENNTGTKSIAPRTITDTYSWAINDDINPSVVGGFLNSTVNYDKVGIATVNGKKASIWDMKAFNQAEPKNGYQTRQVSTRHSIEPYVPDQQLLSYGPTSNAGSTTVEVSLLWGAIPTVTWSFNKQHVEIVDMSSKSSGYGKWTLDFVLGKDNAKTPYTYEPGIRASNASGQMKFQHNHFAKFYKNLSAEATESTPLVVKNLTDL